MHGFNGIPHVFPVNSGGQAQVKVLPTTEQVAEFKQVSGPQMGTSHSGPVKPKGQPHVLSASG